MSKYNLNLNSHSYNAVLQEVVMELIKELPALKKSVVRMRRELR